MDHLYTNVLQKIPAGIHTLPCIESACGTDTYVDFWLLEVSAALISVLFKRQLYITCLLNTGKLKLSSDLQK